MGRSWAEARMLDSCIVGLKTITPDPDTLEDVETITAHYTGKCRISSTSNAVTDKDAVGQVFADESLILSVPVATAGLIRTDDTVWITAVGPVAGNPAMVAREYRVAGLASTSQSTAARYSIELLS
ncbi:hypothetical protein EV379_1244 [Microterricola gilva]|uniref:Uncharacterized protein n=2 Tax=Microterricola gilva TaxID=393267 RepID=A0A4Q8ALU6_9MICO|nr:hypothetical protein EV379_1244 [Microterricola gilva]